MESMIIDYLLGCEESQAVCIEFRKLGINAFSCDTQPCSGGHPEWHIQEDVLKVIKDHPEIKVGIFFPPCTHLAVSGAAHFIKKREDGRQRQAIEFFMELLNADIPHLAIENPINIISGDYILEHFPDLAQKYGLPIKSTQVIQPYFFGNEHQKTTCLWLKNLPLLYHNSAPNLFDREVTHVNKGEFYEWIDNKTGLKKKMSMFHAQAKGFGGKQQSKDFGSTRSKTFSGIAKAMATQWSNIK